jgi:hypothetical protein
MEVRRSNIEIWEQKMKALFTLVGIASSIFISSASAYEINNHADMSDVAASISAINDTTKNGKLFRLGLKPFLLSAPQQLFPLDTPPIGSGTALEECYGQYKDANGNLAQDGFSAQPTWGSAASGRTNMTIAQLIRFGACYEDATEPNVRSFAHFYNPQNQGAGLSYPEGLYDFGPSSLQWMLSRSPTGPTGRVGINHFTYMDARDAFYFALTSNTPTVSADFNDSNRKRLWGLTFQSLGHVAHHLQDMASPQHVRNDAHCDDKTQCTSGIAGTFDGYRPSGYEKHWGAFPQFTFIQQLAQTATVPILFGLPREFWNINTDNALNTFNPTQPMGTQQGIAAYASTNFTSAGKDFSVINPLLGTPEYRPASGLPFPRPSGQWNNVNITDLYPASQANVAAAIVANLCAGDATNCKMRFMGTETDPAARTSSASIFSQELLRPRINQTDPAYSGSGVFQQNYFTYSDAAKTLIPKAVEYSAGLINYFFRGEMEISLPEEGVYGVVDHAVEKTKGADGFRLIKMKVKNTTAELGTARGIIAQHMTNGEFRAVAKFRRNTCYTPNLMGQIGTVGRGASAITNSPLSCRSLVDEIVVSNPEPVVKSLVAGDVAVTLAFDFPNPIPIEATDLFLQVVFKGTLGEELDAVAVATKDVSEPSFVGFMDATDYRVCNAEMVANWNPYDVLGCPRWSPDSGPAPVTQPMSLAPSEWLFAAWSTPEYARWLGLSADNDAVLARLPAAGIAPGNFLRMAVIGSADATDATLRHSVTTASTVTWTKTFRDGPYVVNAADYSRATSSIVLTKVQGDENDVVPPQSLLMYWAPRGVVLSAWRDRGAATGDELPAPVIYRGEPLWDQDIAVYKTGLLTLPPNKTILDLAYYPAMSSIPTAFDRIAFARGASNKVTATYANFVPQPFVNGQGTV